ncbi:MAG TPA: YhgE/Pip family protein, partial [Propionibacteriaceae bacterium]|nr:YhgE/Pip family protein [Propionibacteriaceae bacterium]
MITLERANSSRRIGPWSLLGLILVPLLIAGGFLWATWDSDTRLDRVEAAVVNLDEPVTIDDQLVPLGRQLAGGLVDGEADQNFSWVLTNDTEAAEGLESGRYAAVVVIPEDFSARATSYAKTDPVEAQPATIEVQTSQVSGIADPVVGQAITAAATKALNSSLTEEYLKNIYLGFNRLGRQFTTLTEAARDLADGAGQLSDGVAKTSSGSAELADGLGRLDDGAQQLASGSSELSDGTSQLAGGLGQLATGARSSAAGAGELADGTDKLATGADQLAGGADQLAAGLRSLRKGTADQPGGTAAYADGVQDFASGLGQYQDQMAGFAQQSDEQLAAIVPCPTQLPAESCPVFYAGLRAGTTVAARGLDDQGQRPGLLSGAQQLAAGADGIDAGVGKLRSGASAYADGVDQYATGVDKLATGTGQLA